VDYVGEGHRRLGRMYELAARETHRRRHIRRRRRLLKYEGRGNCFSKGMRRRRDEARIWSFWMP
jgi:hypothetical protein